MNQALQPNMAKSSECVDREATQPEQIINLIDALDNNVENYEVRLQKILMMLSGQSPVPDDEKVAGIPQAGGLFQDMLNRLQSVHKKSDQVYTTINAIERVLGLG